MVIPYTEHTIDKNEVIRIFRLDVSDIELKWHWDEEDRTIEAIGETDWLFQFDNELPIKMNKPIFIPCGIIHRIIKGSSDLQIKIIKHI